MRNFISIKNNRDFMFMYKRARSLCADCLVLYVRKNKTEDLKLGITVTKKVGKAVIRNRIRRRIKEVFSEFSEVIPPCYDVVVVARGKAACVSYQELRSAMKYLLIKAELI